MKRTLVAVPVAALTTAVAASARSPSPKALHNALLVSSVISFVFDNVEIAAQSIQLQAKSGNEKLARSLTGLALRHLRSVEKNA